MPDAPQITKSSWLMILLLAFIWGGTFLVTEIALTEMPPFWIAATRVGFAATVMIVIWGLRGFRLFTQSPTRGDIAAVIFIGAASSAVPFSLLAWGQQYVTSGFAGVTMAATALIILPLAHFFVPGEAMSPRKVIGFALGFVGVVILIGAQAFESTGTALETQGRLACLGAAGCYATSSIIMLVIRSAGPVFMSLVNYQVPVWSVCLGALLLNEPLPPSLLYAMVLILSGVALSQYGAFRRLFTRTRA